MKAALTLSPALASKIASAVIHAEEMISPSSHFFDRRALESVINDPEVRTWIKALGPLAPQKR